MKFNIALTMILAVVLTAVFATAVSALPVAITSAKLDGQEVFADDAIRLSLERGQEFEFKITLVSSADLSNIDAEAYIAGYEYEDYESISEKTHTFDMEADVSYSKTFTLKLPTDVEQDNYKLRILISDRYGDETSYNYNLVIDAKRHSLNFYDIEISPESEVVAGRALTATVQLENMGEKDEESVKISASIPALGLSDSVYIDSIKTEDDEESEELYMRIPKCAKPGMYDLIVEANYDRKHETIKETMQIEVVANEDCSRLSEPVLALSADYLAVNAGENAEFTATITNNGINSKTYTLAVKGADGWADAAVSPSSTFIIAAKESKQIKVSLEIGKNAAGLKELLVELNADGKQTAQIAVDVDVAAKQAGSFKTVLEVFLVVLVALLVIIALVFGFKNSGKGKVYY
jgi:uncharacterized membrane protein